MKLLCSTCVIANHKDHLEDVTDIADKANEGKEELRELREKCHRSKKGYTAMIELEKTIIEEIKATTSKALDAIDDKRDEVLQKVQKVAGEFKMQVIQHQEDQLKFANEEVQEFTRKKEVDEICGNLIATFLEGNTDFDIINRHTEVKAAFNESPASVDIEELKNHPHKSLIFVPAKHNDSFKTEVVGKIKQADILGQMQPISAEPFTSWIGHGWMLSGKKRPSVDAPPAYIS